MPDPGVSYLFRVMIDGVPLGNFTKISGLSANYETETVKDGGENTHVHDLPGRVTYTNVTLTRPVDYGSMGLSAWFTNFQTNIAKGSKTSRNPARSRRRSSRLCLAWPRVWTSRGADSGLAQERLFALHCGCWRT